MVHRRRIAEPKLPSGGFQLMMTVNHEKASRTILHLGAHKTATTLLQNWLFQNISILKTSKIGVTLARDLDGSAFEKLCYEISKPRPITTSITDAEKALRQIWTAINCPKTHLISKENLLGEAGRLYINAEQVLLNIKRVLPHQDLRLVFYIRRIDHFIESHILQQYAHGMSVSAGQVIDSIGDRTWLSVIEAMEEIFPGRVKVEFYERIRHGVPQFIRRFCQACCIDDALVDQSSMPPVSGQNRSLSVEGLRQLQGVWPDLGRSERVEAFDLIRSQHHTGTGHRPSILTDTQRRHILNHHRDSHIQVVERYADGDRELLKIYGAPVDVNLRTDKLST